MNGESPLQFPCAFPIKVMGVGDPGFQMLVVELVRQHAPDLDETQVRVRDSRAGRYQSVTVTVNARDRAQLDAIYQDLSGHPHIKLVL
ncbi:MAG TPA: DUF493 domain-containing protein [Candidatus Contendobacter sp.]|nr:DUF493 domain-containing protein [Candidatus Contendobacter sp.]HRZ24684.1 DUF493 domain-containing protein [Candidatus Contendobacter sp.]HRZ53397.1 DUF493 domain-containing protein [Candidatus Contendobacter sp.]